MLHLDDEGVAAVKKPSDHTVYAASPAPGPGEPGGIDATLAPETQIGEYTVREVLGKGGFGTVYRAVHPIIAKQAAIKVLCLRYSVDPQVVSRFIAEARAVNQIDHEHIIDIFSFGELPDGRRYYVMEYLEGMPLDRYLKKRGALPSEEALAILEPIARALDATHASGIAHRDLKPANVYLMRREGGWFPKLLDFGIAKLMTDWLPRAHETATGATIGTPHYMSPEQCKGENVDHRTDHYAFGVMAFQMLTGRWPFDARSAAEIMVHHMATTPPIPSSIVPSIPDALDRSIASLLAKDKSSRPERLTPVVRAMAGAVGAAPVTGSTPTSFRLAEPSIVREPFTNPHGSRRRWAVGAAVVMSLVGALWWTALDDRTLVAEPVRSVPVSAVEMFGGAEHPFASRPSSVRVTLDGVPAGAFVRFADGAFQPIVGGTVTVPYGAESLRLDIRADGFASRGIVLVPDRDQRIDARLSRADGSPRDRARSSSKRRKARLRPGADDLLGWEE